MNQSVCLVNLHENNKITSTISKLESKIDDLEISALGRLWSDNIKNI